jgi:hypothetical protein
MRNNFVFFSVFMAILLFVVPVSVGAKYTSGSSYKNIPITFPTTTGSNGSSSSSGNTNVQTPNAILTSQPPQGQSKPQVTPSPSSPDNNTQTPILNCPTGEVVSDLSQCPSLSLPSSSSGNGSANAQTTPNLEKQVQDWLKTNLHNSALTVQNGTLNSVVISFNDSHPYNVRSPLSEIEQLEIVLNLHMIGPQVDDSDTTVLILGRNP